MASPRPTSRIAAPSFLLAIALVVASAAPTIARDAVTVPAGVLGGSAERSAPGAVAATQGIDATARAAWRQFESVVRVEPDVASAAEVRAPIVVPDAKPRVESKATSTAGSVGSASPATFHGRNHVWIPALGVNRSVTGFACRSQAYPVNHVYRWGCAGGNNVYLFGHAHSVFKPLHDAYVSGRLRKDMAVYYAGNDGVVHRYVVRWWKVTTPTNGAWAYAGQARPSLTLQTCVGARSQFRLIVRLTRTD